MQIVVDLLRKMLLLHCVELPGTATNFLLMPAPYSFPPEKTIILGYLCEKQGVLCGVEPFIGPIPVAVFGD